MLFLKCDIKSNIWVNLFNIIFFRFDLKIFVCRVCFECNYDCFDKVIFRGIVCKFF